MTAFNCVQRKPMTNSANENTVRLSFSEIMTTPASEQGDTVHAEIMTCPGVHFI